MNQMQVNLQIRSQGTIDEALLSQNGGFFVSLPLGEDGSLITSAQKGVALHLVVRTEPSDAKLEIAASATFPFEFLTNDTVRQVENGVVESFAVGDLDSKPPKFMDDSEKSFLGVWHEPTSLSNSSTLQPSEEMLESLKALGYLQ